jgi:hypothetical protein
LIEIPAVLILILISHQGPKEINIFEKGTIFSDILYNGYRITFPAVKLTGRGVDHPPHLAPRLKKRVELHLYSPSGPSWSVLG